jgi:prepilin-type N-terminal cleavage/methylation domain-containing protein
VRFPASGEREVPRSCEISESLFSVSDHFYIEERGELDWSRRIPLMLTLARPPVREARLNARQAANRAFTLIELLTVIGIIAILAAITFGVVKGVNERAAIGQAKAELSFLSQALEAYKLQYGSYPQAGSSSSLLTTATTSNQSGILFNALMGKLGPKGAPVNGKVFVEASKLSLSSATTLPSPTDTVSVANAFLDPWGRQYVYGYASGWFKYNLLSVGPDGKVGDTFNAASGAVTSDTANGGADNLYANK